jgi:hypothetical protein
MGIVTDSRNKIYTEALRKNGIPVFGGSLPTGFSGKCDGEQWAEDLLQGENTPHGIFAAVVSNKFWFFMIVGRSADGKQVRLRMVSDSTCHALLAFDRHGLVLYDRAVTLVDRCADKQFVRGIDFETGKLLEVPLDKIS